MRTVSKILRSLSVAAFVVASASGVATAQDILTIAEPDVVLNAAKGFGSANLETDQGGDPLIDGRIQGMEYSIFFYGCKDGANCRSIQFSAFFPDPWTAEKANAFNQQFRWVKAYEKDGANFRMDVDFKGGITRQFLEEQFVTWESFIPDLKEAIQQ